MKLIELVIEAKMSKYYPDEVNREEDNFCEWENRRADDQTHRSASFSCISTIKLS